MLLIRRRSNLLFLMAFITAPLSVKIVPGFGSFPILCQGNNIHEHITVDALSGEAIPYCALSIIAAANTWQDWTEYVPSTNPPFNRLIANPNYDPSHHFDRAGVEDPYRIESRRAFKMGAEYVFSQREIAVQQVRAGNAVNALTAIGRALHALQDFYSHSNFIELSVVERAEVEQALQNPAMIDPMNAAEFAKLTITGYDRRFSDPEEPPGDIYPHRSKSKDCADKPGYVAARVAATIASRNFIRTIRGELGPLNIKCNSRGIPVEIVTSDDPNDKVGAQGIGLSRHLAGEEPLRYAVYFENKATAKAPAQDVLIIDKLDINNLDLNTLRLGPVAFGTRTVTPPTGTISSTGPFSTNVDLRPTQNLIVQIDAVLNPSTGSLTWTFRSLDPATMQPPDDPYAGFLSIGGQGSVAFNIQPKGNVPTGTAISNKASIVFDTNQPLETPVWLNTLDKTSPTSTISVLAATQTSLTFPVRWQGSDVGAGIGTYDVYVSEDSRPFTRWQVQTPTTEAAFTGVNGRNYRFYSIARDLVGNIEGPKTAAETTTSIAVAPGGPGQCTYTLSQSTISAPPTGTSGKLTLTATGTNCGWTASSNKSWAQVYPLSGTTTTAIEYTVYPNFGACESSATLTVGGKTVTVTQSPYPGTEDERFVGMIYFNAFGRVPSSAEIASRVAELRGGVSRAELARRFMSTPEFNLGARFVGGLYVGLLGRDAEYGGWLFQRNALATSVVNHDDLVRNFIESREYTDENTDPSDPAFVRHLYRQVLLRDPSQTEVDSQVVALKALNARGEKGRVVMARAFLTTKEFEQGKGPRLTAFLLYSLLLLRGALPGELDFQAGAIAAAKGELIPTINGFLATNEHRSALQCR
jgi:hypothetical protein